MRDMSDCCHCTHPVVTTGDNGEPFCSKCGLWYVHAEWQKDTRRVESQTEKLSLVDSIMSAGKKGKECPLTQKKSV